LANPKSTLRLPIRSAFLLLLTLLVATCMWMYFQRVLIPHQEQEAAEKQKPRGNLSDLYPRWFGARELLLRGRDPYSADVTHEIQIGYYGRQLDPRLPNDPKDQQAFAYPLYVVWMLAPTVKLPFWIVQRACFLTLTILTAFSVPLWLRILDWRLPFDRAVTWAVLTVSCLPAVQGLKLQQLTLLVAALITMSFAELGRGRLFWAGFLMAFATIKPQLTFLLVIWMCIWVSGNWRERRGILRGFGLTMLLLIGASELLLPGWIKEFREAMAAYYRYTGGGGISLLDVVFTKFWGRLVSVLLGGNLLALLWKMRRSGAGTPQFVYSVALTLATTLLVIPMFAPYNQILLLAPVMLLLRFSRRYLQERPLSRFFLAITKFSIFWPFFSAALLVVGLRFLPTFIIKKAAGLPFYSTLAIPIMVYATLLIAKPGLIEAEAFTLANPRALQPNAAAE